ncbi:hypothetical protein BKK49_12355 [Rodentibacter rarus]|uniref:DUF5906 domain-containing protein n=1 Tax=Rodentibacter rarus TaxID=1908260 RepID=UPI000984FD51|nr:DUF5906 domain-containing protein [Rodentibacter rarus]OOF35680.1 hypothetical protein BKK49_12355 [Rodentibacter rarus]
MMLVGEENSTSINLKDLEKISSRTKLLDKTLIFAPDQGRIVTDGAILKALTGGDVMSFEPKYKDPFDARIQSIFLMTNNAPIIFTEHNGGITRRRVLFHFADKVPDHLIDEDLKSKIKQEIPSIINLLINMFKDDPIKAKKLLEAQRGSDEAIAIKKKNNHLLRFASYLETRKECNGLEPGKKQDHQKAHTAVYSLYRLYCTYFDEQPVKQAIFWDLLKMNLKELKNKYPADKRHLNGAWYTNIYLKND